MVEVVSGDNWSYKTLEVELCTSHSTTTSIIHQTQVQLKNGQQPNQAASEPYEIS